MKTASKPLDELTETELSQEIKSRKNQFYISCVFIGFIAGIALYSTIVNGFGILTALPVAFFPIGAKSGVKYKEVKSELERRATTNC